MAWGGGGEAWAEKLRVIYPRPESEKDQREKYPVQLLKLGLDKSGMEYELQPSPQSMQQGRSFLQLEQGHVIDIAWAMTSPEREQKLLPIRIPIYKAC